MWIVLKYEKRKIGILINELKKKFNDDLEIYNPKFQTKLKMKNKIIVNELSLLGDYLFCYHENFSNPNAINLLKFTKGIKDFINGYKSSQSDIKEFINRLSKYCTASSGKTILSLMSPTKPSLSISLGRFSS